MKNSKIIKERCKFAGKWLLPYRTGGILSRYLYLNIEFPTIYLIFPNAVK